MLNIKSDFHLHTRDDREDSIGHSETELIDHAAARGFGALAITNHNTYTFNNELQRYAEDRGILLIPGIEKTVERKHVLILNSSAAAEKIDTFEDLRKAKEDGLFLIAPHPFFKYPCSLGKKLYEHIELFDALEFCFFYSKWLNFNRKMLKLAEQKGLPVVGNSDCHLLKYMGVCHSIIHAEAQSMEAVFSAIRNNCIQVLSEPIFMPKLPWIFLDMKLTALKEASGSKERTPIIVSATEVGKSRIHIVEEFPE
ncbi:PHP domain-containing protein [candidate division KSB1 bacterium]|nr:PHP domain-containing protein [candidate division KSB1 bacterium]